MSILVASNLQASGGGGTAATLASINGGPISGARNRIINGDMRIDARNAGASVSTSSGTTAYTLDRWLATFEAISKYTVQQSSTAPAGFSKSLLVTSSSAYTPTSGQWFDIVQLIEGFNAADLAWGTADAKTVTLSFWVRSSLTGTFGGAFANSAWTRSYPFSYSISAANTWEYKTITVAGDTTGTWLTDNGVGIGVRFSLGAGSSVSGTAGSWSSTNYWSATGATSVVGTNGATFYITGVQLEAGSVATPFERRSYGQELALASRYFQTYTAANQEWIYNEGNTNAAKWWQSYIAQPMRSTPTATLEGTWTGGSANGIGTISALSAESISASRVSWRVTFTTSGGSGNLMYHTDSFNAKRVLYSSEL